MERIRLIRMVQSVIWLAALITSIMSNQNVIYSIRSSIIALVCYMLSHRRVIEASNRSKKDQ